MKKIISILILIVLTGMLLCGCSHKTYPEGSKSILQNNFTILREDKAFDNEIYLICDKQTKIIYLYIIGIYRMGLSPYYIVVDGEPTIAIYGVNYEYQE